MVVVGLGVVLKVGGGGFSHLFPLLIYPTLQSHLPLIKIKSPSQRHVPPIKTKPGGHPQLPSNNST